MRTWALIACLAIAVPASAQSLPAGWAQRAARTVSSPQAVACTSSRAIVRSWTGEIAAWDGEAVVALPPVGRSAYGRSVAATDDGHVLLQSEHEIARFDGTAWSFLPIDRAPTTRWSQTISAFHALDATHVYFVTAGAIGALDAAGDRFGLFDAGTWRDLFAVDATSPRDLWVAGQGGTVMHFDGTQWSREATGVDVSLTGVRAFSASDVWAWGAGVLLHRDANGWSPQQEGLTAQYGALVSTITGRSPDHVYATGAFGVARREGAAWAITLATASLGEGASVAGACATDHALVVVTSQGALLTHALD